MGAKYSDEDVCRPFLCGLCPHDLFQLMKMEMRPCPKLHSLQLRKEYEEAKAKGIDNYYDRDLEDTLRELMDECDGKIHVALQLLDDKDADEAIEISVAKVTETPEVMELSHRIEHKLREADRFDLERKTDFKIQALEQVEELRTQRAEIQSMLLLDAFNKLDGTCLPQEHVVGSRLYFAPEVILSDHRKLHICDVCGSLLSVYDSGRRLAYHFMGKLHSGYMESRHKFAELQEAKKHKKRRLNEEEDDDDATRYTRPPYDSGIIFHGGSGRQNFDSYYTPFGEIYTIDAAFSSPYGHQAYIFMRDEYVVVDYAPPGTRIDMVVEGPFQTCCELPIFRCTDFEDSVDCAFRCKDTSEVWLFSEYSCVRINIAPRSRNNEIIEGPMMVQDIFPCLKGTVFDRHLDAAFESSVEGEAYLFKGDRYALIRYSPERELIRIGTITEGFPCLRHTIFDSDIGAAFTSHCPHEVYLFKRDYYALLSFTPGSTCCRLIGGVKEILPSWPSIRGILPRLSCFPDPDFHYHSGSEYESEYDQDDYRE